MLTDLPTWPLLFAVDVLQQVCATSFTVKLWSLYGGVHESLLFVRDIHVRVVVILFSFYLKYLFYEYCHGLNIMVVRRDTTVFSKESPHYAVILPTYNQCTFKVHKLIYFFSC